MHTCKRQQSMAFYVEGDVDDLAKLTRLDESVLLEQLHRRYDLDKIYVRIRNYTHQAYVLLYNIYSFS